MASVNCFFGEFDGKDFSNIEDKENWKNLPKEQREKDLKKTLNHIQNLPKEPSIIVFSGGGYHAYWLFDKPVKVTKNNLDELSNLQQRWVNFVKSDLAAKDLSRVLRLPGSKNTKYDPSVEVEFIKVDFNLLYNFEELKSLLPAYSGEIDH